MASRSMSKALLKLERKMELENVRLTNLSAIAKRITGFVAEAHGVSYVYLPNKNQQPAGAERFPDRPYSGKIVSALSQDDWLVIRIANEIDSHNTATKVAIEIAVRFKWVQFGTHGGSPCCVFFTKEKQYDPKFRGCEVVIPEMEESAIMVDVEIGRLWSGQTYEA